jgi:hypothetical protein
MSHYFLFKFQYFCHFIRQFHWLSMKNNFKEAILIFYVQKPVQTNGIMNWRFYSLNLCFLFLRFQSARWYFWHKSQEILESTLVFAQNSVRSDWFRQKISTEKTQKWMQLIGFAFSRHILSFWLFCAFGLLLSKLCWFV